jgi:serine/threonine protein kinase/tetratricopeptide (TPR) repeat protein
MPSALRIMEEIVDLPPSERAAALDRLCGDDADLRREVEELLALDEESAGFLEPPTDDERLRAVVQSFEAAPDAIGPYRVVRKVGEGGFGIVYEAMQREPIDRRVALKVVKPGMDSAGVLRRFAMERRMLAQLEHANIARVLDAGLVPEGQPGAGRPYFAMEFVEGLPITAFAEREDLGLQARLELIMQVCAAAQHAHTKGIIHRDLKPANILVSMTDGSPICKVIDYGVAKALGDDDSPDGGFTAVTNPGAMIGTPLYMSPEQAQGSVDVDTRSDVYAIGVVLYELLCGRTPFDDAMSGTRDPERIRSAIESADPASPSIRLSRATRDGGSARSANPPLEASYLRGELDWITMKAIARDPARRYTSASALADDLQRYLANEPVEAGPESRAYRVSKFVRRNRVGVIAGGIAAAGVLAGSVFSVWFGVQANLARKAEQDQRVLAERNAERVNNINEFLTEDLFFAAAPDELGGEATIAELLEASAPRIEDRFGEDPPTLAAMWGLMGAMYARTSRYTDAAEYLDRSLKLINSGVTVEPDVLAGILMHRAQASLVTGDHVAAEREAMRAVELARHERNAGHRRFQREEVANAELILGSIYAATNDVARGGPLLTSAIETFHETGNHGQRAKALSFYAQLLWSHGRFDEALEATKDLITDGEKSGTRADRLAALTGRFWKAAYGLQVGRSDDEAPDIDLLVSGSAELIGAESPQHASALILAMQIYANADRCEEAIAAGDRALRVFEAVFGPRHYEVERYSNSVAAMRQKCGDTAGWRELRTRGLLLRLIIAGPTEGPSVTGLAEPGTEVFGSLDAWADRVADEAQRSAASGENTALLTNAGLFLASVGRLDSAESSYRKALASLDGSKESERWRDTIAQRFGQLLRDSGRGVEAESLDAGLPATPAGDSGPKRGTDLNE